MDVWADEQSFAAFGQIIGPATQQAGLDAKPLETLGGYAASKATGIAEILLPDILTYDYTSPAGFLNGRKLADDVIDAELSLVTNGQITSDFVGPHTDYLSRFPYLGRPH